MPGPRPKPLQTLTLQGSKHAQYARADEMEPALLGNCGPPAWLGETGQRVWRETAAALPAGVLCETDAGILALYCHVWDEFFAAKETIDQQGRWLVSEKTGGQYMHPAYAALCRARADIVRIGGLMGLSPSDRARVSVADPGSGKLAKFGIAGGDPAAQFVDPIDDFTQTG